MQKRILAAWTIILVTGLLLSCVAGCVKIEPEEIATELTVSPTAIFTPTPTPRRTPLPTREVLSEEEMENEIKLLGIKNLEETIDFQTLFLIYYTYLDDNDIEIQNISLAFAGGSIDGNVKTCNIYDNFTSELLFTCYSDLNAKYIEDLVDVDIQTNIKKFKGLDFKAVIPFIGCNFEYFEQDFGIELNLTPWLWKMDYKASNNLEYSAPAIEFARGYIEIVPRKYRTNAATFIDDPVITPTVS